MTDIGLFEAIHTARSLRRYHDTPVVMLSSKDGLFDRARGRLVGSEEYLTKPFTKDSLLKCVAEHSRKSATVGMAV